MLRNWLGVNTSLAIPELLIIRWLELDWLVAGHAFGVVTLSVFYGAQLCRYFEVLLLRSLSRSFGRVGRIEQSLRSRLAARAKVDSLNTLY